MIHDHYYTTSELMKYLRVSMCTIKRLCRKGVLKYEVVAYRRLFPKTVIEDYLASFRNRR
jgi:excisionase family DNA binding protein